MTNNHIDPWLRDILRCPITHSELLDGTGPDGAPELQAKDADEQGRRRAYRVEDGIPVLIPEEARFMD